ncbi:MAG: type II toxin-antitoxin system VapC family toxin [Candidatus Micrarchaeia archaeon]
MHLVDANIFLEIELQQAHSEACKQFLRSVHEGKTEALLTDFSIDLIAIVMESEGKKPRHIRTFLASLLAYKGLKFHVFSLAEKIAATALMEEHGLGFGDALTLQAMRSRGVTTIVSLDKDFDRVKEIKRLQPSEAVKQS